MGCESGRSDCGTRKHPSVGRTREGPSTWSAAHELTPVPDFALPFLQTCTLTGDAEQNTRGMELQLAVLRVERAFPAFSRDLLNGFSWPGQAKVDFQAWPWPGQLSPRDQGDALGSSAMI